MRKFVTTGMLALVFCCASAAAQLEPQISDLTALDRKFMQEQRTRIDDLARSSLGRQLNGAVDSDLAILQLLLDRKAVSSSQTLELQAMGVVMGDLLAVEPTVRWVIYQDRQGRSRALRTGQSDNYIFPITMISRRVEAGATVDVSALYDKAYKLMEPYLPALPFQ